VDAGVVGGVEICEEPGRRAVEMPGYQFARNAALRFSLFAFRFSLFPFRFAFPPRLKCGFSSENRSAEKATGWRRCGAKPLEADQISNRIRIGATSRQSGRIAAPGSPKTMSLERDSRAHIQAESKHLQCPLLEVDFGKPGEPHPLVHRPGSFHRPG